MEADDARGASTGHQERRIKKPAAKGQPRASHNTCLLVANLFQPGGRLQPVHALSPARVAGMVSPRSVGPTARFPEYATGGKADWLILRSRLQSGPGTAGVLRKEENQLGQR